MTWQISDSFADPLGRWNQVAPWDATEYYDGAKGFLTTQSHVDLRTFRVIPEFVGRPQSDLAAVKQTAWESPVVQKTMEQKVSNTIQEPWVVGSITANLTTSGNEITDANRGTAGDGLANDSSFGIWQAATNLTPNGGFEIDTSTWALLQGTETMTRVTTDFKFGTACLKVHCPNIVFGGSQGVFTPTAFGTLTGTTKYTLSMWLKGAVGGERFIFFAHEYQADGATSNGFDNSPTITLTNTWQRYQLTFTTAATTTKVKLGINSIDTLIDTDFFMDGVQIEKEVCATPYIDTTTVAVTRNNAFVQGPVGALGTPSQGWAAMRVIWGLTAAQVPAVGSTGWVDLFRWGTGVSDFIELYYDGGDLVFGRDSSGAGTGTPFVTSSYVSVPGTACTVVVKWDATAIYISVDGGAFISVGSTYLPTLTATLFDIGSRTVAAPTAPHCFDGNYKWFMAGGGVLTNADATTLNALGNTDPSMTTLGTTADTRLAWSASTASSSQSGGLGNLVLGPESSRGGWPALKLTTNGLAVNATLTSSIPSDNRDISGMSFVELVIPDYNAFDTTSSIQLTSDPNGVFGNGFDSTAVAFSSNLSLMPLLKLNVSAFAHAGFDNTKVTGVRVTLVKATAPTAGQTVSLLALRAVNSTWVDSFIDFDTRLGALVAPVADAGIPYAGSVGQNFEFIRGDSTQNDPIPSNGAYQIAFFPGGQTSPNDATGGIFNVISLIFRENKNSGAGTGSFMEARLKFNDTQTVCEIQRTDMSGGAGGTRTPGTLHSQVVGSALDPTRHFIFRVEVTGTTVQPKLYHCDVNLNPGDIVWTGSPVSSSELVYRNGRVGFRGSLVSRDSYILDYSASPTGFAAFQTKPLVSITPIDGVRLAANFAQDANLFSSFTGPDLSFDGTKTISGNGAWQASQAIQTNQFIVDDWNHTYLSASIWVGSAATLTQPEILLNGSIALPIKTDRLGPNQWNNIFVDLSRFKNQITGTPYYIVIQPDPSAVTGLGTFWVDNMTVGRRQVAWAARATPNGIWREFLGTINDPQAGLHFNIDERGTALQIQATALTTDAWIAVGGGMKVWPKYAALGAPVYDVSATPWL